MHQTAHLECHNLLLLFSQLTWTLGISTFSPWLSRNTMLENDLLGFFELYMMSLAAKKQKSSDVLSMQLPYIESDDWIVTAVHSVWVWK